MNKVLTNLNSLIYNLGAGYSLVGEATTGIWIAAAEWWRHHEQV